MEELQTLIDNLDLEELDYYYHITSRGFGDEIISDGLYLEEPDLRTTTIKLPKELLDNPFKYCEEEFADGVSKRKEMVMIGCFKDDGNNIIFPADISKWSGDQELKYLIRSENILGYIDLETFNVTYNPGYIDFNYRR